MPYVISEENYVKWVKRSLNRSIGARLKVDGNKTPRYRKAVSSFQLITVPKYYMYPVALFGNVDEETQDAIIRLNHSSEEYLNWMQKALTATGHAVVVTGVLDSATIEKLREFQSRKDLGLENDGWVGAKTETRLFEISKLEPPGSTVPVIPKPTPIRWHGGIFNGNLWFKMFTHEIDEGLKHGTEPPYRDIPKNDRVAFQCVLKKSTNLGWKSDYLGKQALEDWARRDLAMLGLRAALTNAAKEISRDFTRIYDNPKYTTREQAFAEFERLVLEVLWAIYRGREHAHRLHHIHGDLAFWRGNIEAFVRGAEKDPKHIYNCFTTLL